MATDYRKSIRTAVVLVSLTVLPLCMILMECCGPASDEVAGSFAGRRHGSGRPGPYNASNVPTAADLDPEADYADLDRKILHRLDVEEHESEAYYRRKSVLEARTTPPVRASSARDPVDCRLLFEDDANEMNRVRLKLRRRPERLPTERDVIAMTADCSAYVGRRGYVTRALSRAEAEFPLAFSIRLHDRVAQLERLLRAIYRPNNVYCLYVDAKSPPPVHEAVRSLARCFANVFVASRLEPYVYASFSPVRADLQCMAELLRADGRWKYYLNLAGTEFPLKTNREIVEILKVLNGSNDIEQYPFPTRYEHRFRFRHVVVGGKLVQTDEPKEAFVPGDGFSYAAAAAAAAAERQDGAMAADGTAHRDAAAAPSDVSRRPAVGGSDLPLPANVTLQKGCSYNSFSRPFVQWLLSDPLAQSFINWTRDTDSPDELVWATLNHMPGAPGGYQTMVTQIAKTFLSREVIWEASAAYCHGSRRVHGVCILSVGDLPWLSRRWELFANKFDIYYDNYVIDCLQEALDNRTRHPDPDRDINWQGIYLAPHVKVKPTQARMEYMRRNGYG